VRLPGLLGTRDPDEGGDISPATLADGFDDRSPAGALESGLPAVPLAYRPLAGCLEGAIDRARGTESPVALLLLSPRVRRPTGQRLNSRTESAVLQGMIDFLAGLVLKSDQIVKVDGGLIAVVLYGATDIGAQGVSRKIARRLDDVRDLAGRDVRARVRSAFSLFPEEGTSAPDLIRLARRRLVAEA
jgi:hypothetical protein